jgi:serine/threonine protein kinase
MAAAVKVHGQIDMCRSCAATNCCFSAAAVLLQNPPPQLDDKQGRKHFSKVWDWCQTAELCLIVSSDCGSCSKRVEKQPAPASYCVVSSVLLSLLLLFMLLPLLLCACCAACCCQAMRNLVARCLQKDHKQRPSARELLEDKFFKVSCFYKQIQLVDLQGKSKGLTATSAEQH